MKKPLIAVDIDEVLFPFTENLVAFHNERYGTQHTFSDVQSFKLHELWGGTAEDAMRKVSEFQATGAITNVVPLPAAIEAIGTLNNHYRLAVVTSRQSSIQEETGEWLQRHFPDAFNEVRFANYWDETMPQVTKADVCSMVGADILIEDHLDYAFDCAERGMRVLLFGNYPWNQDAELPHGVTRVADWAEALRELGID